eukprot:10538169-Alexandrium_andersonii.AAC.1
MRKLLRAFGASIARAQNSERRQLSKIGCYPQAGPPEEVSEWARLNEPSSGPRAHSRNPSIGSQRRVAKNAPSPHQNRRAAELPPPTRNAPLQFD